MTRLNSLFTQFLSNIEPDSAAVNFAIEAHLPIREFLSTDDSFSDYVENTFLYGSYKRHTAVGDIKDVDIVVITNFDILLTENSPQKVLTRLKNALLSYYENPENPQFQRRSIRIDQPLEDHPDIEMTLDILPAVITEDEDTPLRIPDRLVQEWIWSHPKGHLERTTALNSDEFSRGKFVPLVKMMKWWWKYQCSVIQPEVERPKPKGFWLECLTSENFDPEQNDWADHFITLLSNLISKYSYANVVPDLVDPGMDSEIVKTNMSLEEFIIFIDALKESHEISIAARDNQDDYESSKLWRKVFGDAFPLDKSNEPKKQVSTFTGLALGDFSHAKPLEEKIDLREHVTLESHLYHAGNEIGILKSDDRILQSGFRIKFVARPSLHPPYEVKWQVINTGPHAREKDGLRGGFFEARLISGVPSSNPLVNWEKTLYTGKHWIECFIIKDKICIARSGKFFVNIQNPDFPP